MKMNKIALLGVDGTGKSTMSKELKKYLEKKGYNVKIIPFHKWVIAGYLRHIFGKVVDKGRKDRKTPYKPPKKSIASILKPPIAFLDNLLFLLINSPKKKDIYIYDRFVCATQIKLNALGYQNAWFKTFWMSIKPDIAIIFDVDLVKSVNRQIERNDPYTYPKNILEKERELYFHYAKEHSFPIIISNEIEKTKIELFKIIDTKIG